MKKRLLIITCIFVSLTSYAQTQLWGMTSVGGQYNAGTIFRTDGSGNLQTVIHSFFQAEGARPLYTNVIQATDGKFYGMTAAGGVNNFGVLFQYDPATNVYVKKIDFAGLTNGSDPRGSLVQAADGKLYGMTRRGGLNNFGILFQYDPITNILVNKIDFAGASNGKNPLGSLMQATDGMLYGLTNLGGTAGLGVLFQFDPATGLFTKKFDFTGLIDGQNPFGSLMQALDGKLYGLAFGGGTNGVGTLFQFDPVSNIFIKKYDFAGPVDGQNPIGSLMQATDGKLYGLTSAGGANGVGTIVQYNYATNVLTNLFDFSGIATGGTPPNSLIQATDGKLYGMTNTGGANGIGTLFQFDPATLGFLNKFDFTGIDGDSPSGSLMQASDGKLYGMTEIGGANASGVVFQYDPFTSAYIKKFDFGVVANPFGSLVQATDNKLYGMTQTGGANALGTIFQYDPATNIYIDKIDFSGAATGDTPLGSLIQATDGTLYGMTSAGGANGFGVLFQYNPLTNILIDKFDFSGIASGDTPLGSLVQAIDGTLYGVTSAGGANAFGTLFQFNPVTNVFTNKFDFNGAISGNTPFGSLIQAGDGNLYGLTSAGGANGFGTLFQFDPVANIFINKFDFTGVVTGDTPLGSLIQATNGNLYGLASAGGANGFGTLFQFDPVVNIFVNKFDFSSATTGDTPMGTLKEASNGMLYGLTSAGGANGAGTLFQFDLITNTFTNKLDFTGTNGDSPQYTQLIEITAVSGAGINNMVNSNSQLLIYPNPAIESFTIEFSTLQGEAGIEIENTLGQIVYSTKTNQLKITIDVSDLQSGIYFVRATTSKENSINKLIVK